MAGKKFTPGDAFRDFARQNMVQEIERISSALDRLRSELENDANWPPDCRSCVLPVIDGVDCRVYDGLIEIALKLPPLELLRGSWADMAARAISKMHQFGVDLRSWGAVPKDKFRVWITQNPVLKAYFTYYKPFDELVITRNIASIWDEMHHSKDGFISYTSMPIELSSRVLNEWGEVWVSGANMTEIDEMVAGLTSPDSKKTACADASKPTCKETGFHSGVLHITLPAAMVSDRPDVIIVQPCE